ncbi:cyclopropane-fatty-acyl-phospholipid synthase family protein [Mycoavidus sp. HKI]|uniref:SAM-dependent methyltransferase n=1 Tax=Mycoavidus sp. HKI TaxID=2840467 RepID=UPI001CC08FC8|nr:cyclopropane-fatty-acyl-phospholipid synthase family protein [Mycoavidus sp. HKI]UAW63817.1 cyclopropane-fatty-acyl-phospholipid synthase family protein [Mycoavidus sp. HKI]
MLWEKKLAQWAAEIQERANISARLVLWNGQHYDFGHFATPQIIFHINSAAALPYLIKPNLSTLGEAYIKGKIDVTGKLADLIEIAYSLVENTTKPSAKLSHIYRRFAHLFAHTRTTDKKSIQYHYDLSNQFYQLWLDQNMVYSCAYFENGDEDLDTAQLKKIDHILTKIQLKPGHTLLDIGCGWGALVMRAAQKFGAKCVGVTLSQKQFELATERIKQAGLTHQIDLRLQDYRDITPALSGQFDRITSVGMFEHVGRKNLPSYFSKISALLKEGGIMMNHGITSTALKPGENSLGGDEFIDHYVFPNGELPHLNLVLAAMQQGGLETFDIENLRRHYARTLTFWSERFEQQAPQIKAWVNEEKFRIWRVYLAGSIYAFEHDDVAIYQIVCGKAGRSAHSLPWSRRYMYS